MSGGVGDGEAVAVGVSVGGGVGVKVGGTGVTVGGSGVGLGSAVACGVQAAMTSMSKISRGKPRRRIIDSLD